MIRATITAIVRSQPVRKAGKTKGGNDYAFFVVGFLDSDYNKFEGRIDEGLFPSLAAHFGEGAKVDLTVDVTAWNGNVQVAVQEARPAEGLRKAS